MKSRKLEVSHLTLINETQTCVRVRLDGAADWLLTQVNVEEKGAGTWFRILHILNILCRCMDV